MWLFFNWILFPLGCGIVLVIVFLRIANENQAAAKAKLLEKSKPPHNWHDDYQREKAEAEKPRNPKAEAERLRDELGHPEAF